MSSGERPLGYARAAVEDRVLSWTDYGFGLVGDQVTNIDERYYTAKPLTRFKDAIIAGPLDEEHVMEDYPDSLVEPNWKKFGLSPEKPDWSRFRELCMEIQISHRWEDWQSTCGVSQERLEAVRAFYELCDEKEVESVVTAVSNSGRNLRKRFKRAKRLNT